MMDYEDIEKEADNLTEAYSEIPVPVYDITRKLGVKVWIADFGEIAGEYSGFCDFDRGEIYLNREDNTRRRIFTTAHELGHLRLHEEHFKSKGERFAFLPRHPNVTDDSPQEKEANLFARCLLLPRPALEPRLREKNEQDILAAAFNVTTDLLEERRKEIASQE